ncbi:MAG: hypothetical protein ACT4PV_12135 [Planctomycetaceae bacterium]
MRRALALICLVALAAAQDGKPPAKPEIHKIYVPYEKLDEVFGTDKERVLVPYKEFLELWNLKYGPKEGADRPPLPFTVESASYEGSVRDGLAVFSALLEVEVFVDSWQRIPLPYRDVAFEEITLDGAPGVLVPTANGYELVLKGKGRRRISARFVAGIARGKELATCAFGLPPVPLHKLSFKVPGKGTEITIEPARAFTTATEGDETTLLAFLGAQADVKLTWRFRPEETAKEPPLLFSTDLIDVRVEERVLRGDVRFDLEVLRTAVDELSIRVPEGVQVLEVEGADIKTWGFADAARTTLRVALHKPQLGRYALRVGFEAPVTVPGALAFPVFAVPAAARERGFLRIAAAEGVGLRPGRAENAFQVDLDQLPDPIKGGERALGFRYPALPFTLSVDTERVAPRVTLTTRARLVVERRSVTSSTELNFLVERAGLFAVRMRMPAGITITEIGPAELVDGWRIADEEGKQILMVDLKGRRTGTFVLAITGVAPLELEKGTLAVPLFKVLGVDREEGTLGVFLDPGIKATATTTSVIPIEPDQLLREDAFRSPTGLPLAFAWRWRGGEASVSFAVEAQKPKVSCEVRAALQGEEARTRVSMDLAYRVEYTGVESFRFRVPRHLVERLKVEGRNVREKPHVDDPVEEGKEPTATYTVSMQGPALGEVLIHLEYDENFPVPIQTNSTQAVAIPAVTPLDVERSTAFVAVRKAAALKADVGPEADYEQIDASELPAALRADDVFLALRRFQGPAPFALLLTKHEYRAVADLVVRHLHLETVLAGDDRATTTAFFEILNNDRQFLAVKLPAGSEILELLVDGKPEKPRLGEGNVLLVPLLTGLRKDASFRLAIAYTHAPATSGALFRETSLAGPLLPAMEESPAPVQTLLTWRVHYPKAWRVTSFAGNVEPALRDAESGSWLSALVARAGRLVQPVRDRAASETVRVLPDFRDIVPMYKERESASTVFANGTGDATLTIAHVSAGAATMLVLLAAALAAAAVWLAARFVTPVRAGGATALLALAFLATAGRAWIPIWNAVLLAALGATAVLRVLEWRRARP